MGAGVPAGLAAATLVRAVADCAAVVALGLAAVPMLDDERYRGELIGRATAPLAVAGAVWLVAELGRLIVAAAQAAAVPVWPAGRTHRGRFRVAHRAGTGRHSSASRQLRPSALAAVAAPRTAPVEPRGGRSRRGGPGGPPAHGPFLRKCAWRSGGCRSHPGGGAVVWRAGGAGADRRASRPVGPGAAAVLAVVAVVCARRCCPAGWSARPLTARIAGRVVRHRLRQAAVGEDRGGGGAGAAGWRNRTIWLPAARAHRTTAVVSRSRSLVELAVMAVALALAAGLAATG